MMVFPKGFFYFPWESGSSRDGDVIWLHLFCQEEWVLESEPGKKGQVPRAVMVVHL